jgi:hypothetical protein
LRGPPAELRVGRAPLKRLTKRCNKAVIRTVGTALRVW